MVLSEVPRFDINGSFGSVEKRFSINFSKANANFCFSLLFNTDKSYLFTNRKEIFTFKVDNKNVNFPIQLCPKSIYNGFNATEHREVSKKGNVYDLSINYNSVGKSDMLKIQKYLMSKNNI